MTVVVGIDPGSRGTGLAVITTERASTAPGWVTPDLLASTTVRRPTDEPVTQPSPAYLAGVVAALRMYVVNHAPDLIAVEGITAPNAHVRVTNPEHIIAAAMVFGAVVSRGYGVPLVVVKPGGHGSKPLGWYPDALVSAAERRDYRVVPGDGSLPVHSWQHRPAGSGQLKDERAAYSVAVAGHAARRLTPTHTYV